jgi:hypothetical protein
VISATEINAMVGMERMKEAIGCNDLSCAAELSGALGADYMVTGSVSVLGSSLIISLTLIDAKAQKVINRTRETFVNKEDLYMSGIITAVKKLFGGEAAKEQTDLAVKTTTSSNEGGNEGGHEYVPSAEERKKQELEAKRAKAAEHKKEKVAQEERSENKVNAKAVRVIEAKYNKYRRMKRAGVGVLVPGLGLMVVGAALFAVLGLSVGAIALVALGAGMFAIGLPIAIVGGILKHRWHRKLNEVTARITPIFAVDPTRKLSYGGISIAF